MALSSPAPMLEGVRVIDLTTVVFGPHCTQILADLGADVVKIEAPQGDVFRFTTKPAHTRGMSGGHLALNRGKRSAVLDLKNADDLASMRGLLKTADVFIHNVRSQAIERLGLGYEAVRDLNPNIIYAHCVGFGSEGPYADLQAYDDVIQAASGAATIAPRVDGIAQPRYIPSLIADKVAGLHAAYSVIAAIVHRLRTGEGQFIEAPMFEIFTSFMLTEHLAGQTFDPPKGPICYPRQIDPARQPFPTADGYISIVPYTDEAFVSLFKLLGAPHVLDEERFSTPRARVKNVTALYGEIAQLTPQRYTADWLSLLQPAQIPAMAVRDIADIRDDPHLKAMDFFKTRQHPTEGAFHEMRPPVRFSAYAPQPPAPAPTIGQHSEDIRREAASQTPAF